jgi:hypothetical protein
MTDDFLEKADIDDPHFFWGSLHRSPSLSHLRLYRNPWRTIAIATEVDANPSLSLTNGAEEAIAAAIVQYQLAPATLLWVEHDCQDRIAWERFRLVFFAQNPRTRRYAAPRWHQISRQEVAALIDGSNAPLVRIMRQQLTIPREEQQRLE